jgi:hypothetical protein
MRQEQQSLAPAQNTADFKISFQMTNAGARHACSVTIRALSKTDATIIFQQNWLTIEKLARKSLTSDGRREIRLESLLPAPVRPSRPEQSSRERRNHRVSRSHEAVDRRRADSSTAPAIAINPPVQ